MHRLRQPGDLLLAQPAVPVLRDGHHHRVDAARHVRTTGGRVVVGSVVERLEDHGRGLLLGHLLPVELLERAAGEDRAGADPGEAQLLGAAAGHVVGEDPARTAVLIEAGEQRHHGQPLHRHAQIAADHRGEPVGLALQREGGALHLLEVLQLQLEQLHHLHRQPRGARNTHGGVLVGGKDLLDVPLRDDVAHRRPPVPGQHHTAREGRCHDRGAVRRLHGTPTGGSGRLPGNCSGAWSDRKSMNDDDPGVRKAAGRRPVLRISASTRFLPRRLPHAA